MQVHQNIVIDGKDYGTRSIRKHSKFYNEGKWTNFIEPLLPEDCSGLSLLEIGCNAGLLLSLAKKKGFRRVIGIEKDKDAYDMAVKYRDSLGMDYDIWNTEIDEKFDIDSLPTVDVLLLANSHYYIFIPTFLKFVNLMRRKVRHLVLVSVTRAKVTRHYPLADVKSVREYFKFWEEVKVIKGIDPAGDPHPRSMYSVLFKTELERMSIDDIIEHTMKWDNGRKHFKRVLGSKGRLHPLVAKIREHELTSPLLAHKDTRLIDGSHRIVAAKEAGLTHVIVELCRSKD